MQDKLRLILAIDIVDSVMREMLAAVFACGDFAKSSRAVCFDARGAMTMRVERTKRRFRNLHPGCTPVSDTCRVSAAAFCGAAQHGRGLPQSENGKEKKETRGPGRTA